MNKISMYATKSEIKEYSINNNMVFTHLILAQIYSLYIYAKWTRSQIADHLDYAVSTISSKRSQMWDYEWLAEELFKDEASPIAENEAPTIAKVLYRNFRDGRPSVPMEFMADCGENLKDEEAVYFFKFYNEHNLEFNKIGTTAKDVIGRLRREIGDYSENFNICRVEIHRIRSCGEIPAEGAESALRAELIKRYPKAFRKNDRFFGVDISPTVFDEIVNEFFN